MNEIIQCALFKFPFIGHGFLTKAHSVISAPRLRGVQAPVGIQCRVKQVHGNTVIHVKDPNTDYKHLEADIMVTDLLRIALTISTADCVPLLFCDPTKKVIAASHAGWRGTAKNVAQTTIMALQKTGQCRPENILVAIGPCIHSCCYEVDALVFNSFSNKDFFKHNPSHKDRWMFDLPNMNRYQLIQAGVLAKHIWISPFCTSCRTDLFYSYRKEKTSSRQYSFITLL